MSYFSQALTVQNCQKGKCPRTFLLLLDESEFSIKKNPGDENPPEKVAAMCELTQLVRPERRFIVDEIGRSSVQSWRTRMIPQDMMCHVRGLQESKNESIRRIGVAGPYIYLECACQFAAL